MDRCELVNIQVPHTMFADAPVLERLPKETYYRLDVYKRQGMRNTLQQGVSGYSADGPSICGGYLWEELPHPEEAQGAIPVSYTHLLIIKCIIRFYHESVILSSVNVILYMITVI